MGSMPFMCLVTWLPPAAPTTIVLAEYAADQSMSTEAVMKRIEGAMAVYQEGDKDAARQLFEALWSELDPAGEPLCRCVLAHHMADWQDNLEDELAWDLRALAAAARLTDAAVKHLHPSLTVAEFYPSLLLNVADDYRKLGRVAEAREYLNQAERSVEVLPTTEYGGMIRGGIRRLAERLRT